MWVTKLLISPVKKRIFCPKTTKFGPKLAFLVNLGQAMQAYSVPCWWVGWWLWRAGCISQDTYLLYLYFHITSTFVFNNIQFKYLRLLFVINISKYLQLLLLYLFPFRHLPLDLGLAAHACPKRPDLGRKMVKIKFCMFKDV